MTTPENSVLIVDAANVVGSVPDGWWRDRAEAARRLHAHLLTTDLAYATVVLVLEGKARAGVNPGSTQRAPTIHDAASSRPGQLITVHAPGEGDDELVRQCEQWSEQAAVSLATADRGLIDRVAHLRVQIIGPRSIRH